MTLFLFLSLLLTVSMTSGQAVPVPVAVHDRIPVQVDPAALERLAVATEQALPSGRHLRLKVTKSIWTPAEGKLTPDLKAAPAYVKRLTVTMRGDQRLTVAHEGNPNYVQVWADGASYNIELDRRIATAHACAMSDPHDLQLHLLMQVAMSGEFGAQGPGGCIRRGEPIAYSEAGSNVTFRYIVPGFQENLDRFAKERDRPPMRAHASELTMDIADPPRLLGTARELPPLKGNAKLLDATSKVEEWHHVGDIALPRVIRSVWPDRRNGSEQWIITRVEAAEVIAADAPLPQALPDGLVVTDGTLQLTFTVGSRDITYQGRTLKLTEPLTGHPGSTLQEILVTAVER